MSNLQYIQIFNTLSPYNPVFFTPVFIFSSSVTQMEIWVWSTQMAPSAPPASREWPSSTLSATRLLVRQRSFALSFLTFTISFTSEPSSGRIRNYTMADNEGRCHQNKLFLNSVHTFCSAYSLKVRLIKDRIHLIFVITFKKLTFTRQNKEKYDLSAVPLFPYQCPVHIIFNTFNHTCRDIEIFFL